MKKVASLDAKRYTSSASSTGSDVKLATWALTWSDRHHDGVPWEPFTVLLFTSRLAATAPESQQLFVITRAKDDNGDGAAIKHLPSVSHSCQGQAC